MSSLFVQRIQAHLLAINEARPKREWLTPYKIALDAGLDPTYVANIFQGRKNGSPDTLRKLAQSRLLNLSYETLRSWQALSELEPAVLEACLNDSQLQFLPNAGRFEAIPCRGEVSAGGFRFFNHPDDIAYFEWWDLEDFPADERASLCCFKVKGDSMWPPIPNGSLLLVREVLPATNLKPGRWYVIFTNHEEATFKAVTYNAERLQLEPLNPAYPPQRIDQSTILQSFEVIKYQVSLL